MALQSQQGASNRVHNARAPFKTPKAEGQAQALAATCGSVRSPKPTQPRVFARLQALFPPSLTSYTPPSPTILPPTNPLPTAPDPQFIKTRIITWNMHDSLPKGDLAELLGTVPLYTPRIITDQADRMALPGLSLDDAHPYHLVIVGGQECPTLSGIPMGLAANFKHRDGKERDKEKHKDSDDLEKDYDKDREFSKENLLQHTKSLLTKRLKHEQLLHSRSTSSDPAIDVPPVHVPVTTSGWSTVLEDWFSNGVGSLRDVKPVVTTTAPDPSGSSKASSTPDSEHCLPGTIGVDWKPSSPAGTDDPKTFPASSARTKTGPYELLVKERLMGIYTAVYVHRDVRRLVRDFSTGTVPAGLIGGRLGNKGGVGVSINFDGNTLLFINAHLAAHEDKVSLRVANLAKIKAELSVESFLSPDDPRVFSEDVTDKFDHTYIFGDLNFRLDISRLHADWLISRKEYTQALAFDQLAKLIKDEDPTFVGLHEAVVNFPPTFKYDVMRSMKRERLRSRYSQKYFKGNSEHPSEKDDSKADSNQDDDEDDGERAESISLRSSAWTSSHSRHRTDVTDDEGSDDSPINSPTNHGALLSPTSKLMSHAAFKAKAACIALIHGPRNRKQVIKKSLAHNRGPSTSKFDMPMSSVELPHAKKVSLDASVESLNNPKMKHAASVKSPVSSHKHGEASDPDKGVYDSSSKQRVPSWCDRILWKTTVEPPKNDVELEAETDPTRSRGRANRMGQIFLHAFRSRPRQDSTQTKASGDGSKPTPDNVVSGAHLSLSTLLPTANGTPLTSSPGLYQSKSLDMPSPAAHQDMHLVKYDKRGRPRSVSALGHGGGKGPRRLSLPIPNTAPISISHPRRAETDQLLAVRPHDNSAVPPSPIASSARIASKRWFLNLISRDTPPSSSPTVSTVEPPAPQHRKGDIVCFSYHTLDDGQMKRLEGRSDHRPVIGSYAIYI